MMGFFLKTPSLLNDFAERCLGGCWSMLPPCRDGAVKHQRTGQRSARVQESTAVKGAFPPSFESGLQKNGQTE